MEIPTKKPKLFKTTVVRCYHCKMWYTRVPTFYGWGGDKGDECDYCGCSSFTEHPGRDIGVKSDKYQDCVDMLNEFLRLWGYYSEFEQQMVYDNVVFE